MNDEHWNWSSDDKGYLKTDENGKHYRITPEERFVKMRKWVVSNINGEL